MNSKIIGELIKDPEISKFIETKEVIGKNRTTVPFSNGKEAIYRFAFDQNEELTIEQADVALDNFFNLKLKVKQQVAEKLFENWQEFNDTVGYLDGIEVYGSVEDRPEWMERSLQNCLWLEKLSSSKKVWDYVRPTEVIITKDRYKKREGVFVQVLCECDWEEEHGLQIVLKNGNELIRVSGQDGHLFDFYDKNGNRLLE